MAHHSIFELGLRRGGGAQRAITSVPYMDMGIEDGATGVTEWRIETTKWQLRVELDTWLLRETSRRTPHFHVTYIKWRNKYN
jgi:hypothetical protein